MNEENISGGSSLRYRYYFNRLQQFYRIKKVRTYTAVVATLLAISFFIFFAIKPTLVTITTLNKQIKDQRLVSSTLETKITNLSQAQKDYLSIEPDLYLINECLPNDPKPSLLARNIEALALKSGITLKTIQLDQVDLKGGTNFEKPLPISFSLASEGTYQSLKDFIGSLSDLRRIIQIESFAFKSSAKKGENILSLSLKGRAYYLLVNQNTKSQ